jgi:hypothetical protein
MWGLGAAVPDRRMPVLATLGHPTEPAIQQAADLDIVQHVVQLRQRKQLVLVAAARPAAVAPQQVAPDGGHRQAWAVWLWRLASYSTFWLAHPRGRCTRVASPSTQTASADAAISPSQWRRSARLVMKVPPGWQNPTAAKGPSRRSQAVAHLGLGDPNHAAGAPVRQPVQQHRGDRVQAGLQRQWRGAALAGRSRWQQVGQASGQPAKHGCGQRRTWAVCQGDQSSRQRREPAYGLVPVNVRAHRASRTP